MRLNLNETFARAARLTWSHRTLWLYGFLLVILGGECLRFGGETNLGGDQLQDAVNALRRADPNTLRTIALVAAALIGGFWLLSVLAGNWALGALLGGLDQALTEGGTSLRASAAAGRRRFWPLVAVGFLTGGVAALIAVPSVATAVYGALAQQPGFFALACLWLPFAVLVWLAVGLLATLAQLHIVLSGAGPLEALTYAWRFLATHAGDLLLVWAANDVGVGCAAGCLTAFLILISSIPAWIGFAINPVLGFVLLLPALVLSLIVLIARGVVAVFQKAVWLLAFENLQRGEGS